VTSEIASTASARARRLKAIEAIAVVGMTHPEAAAYAGMTVNSVRALMQKDEVKRYIADIQQAQAKKLNVSREQVLQGMLNAIDHAVLLGEPATELRGWEALAKLQGYNAPERHIHEIPEDTKRYLDTVKEMRDEELYELTGKRSLIQLSEDDFARVD